MGLSVRLPFYLIARKGKKHVQHSIDAFDSVLIRMPTYNVCGENGYSP
jgi:hypothetical protein